MAVLTVYPSMDGVVSQVYGTGSGVTWATLIAAAGTNKNDGTSQTSIAYIIANSVASRWRELVRAIYLFNVGALPGGATIVSAVFKVYGYQKADTHGITPSTNVYSSNPASDTGLIPADYASLGSTPFCNTAITYAGWSTSGYNDFILNAAGLAALAAAIGSDSILRLGIRNANYDVSGTQPPWPGAAGVRATFVEQGAPYRPRLVITYTVPAVGRSQAHLIS